ncbi:dihydrodipicolinate synthase family protein [Rhodococcus sp. NPDC057529]|uniref:dihydrodipicolinate synthase family protein n=1 Tax=Rhodococcus sp. NPDC057529 TaxID=3346158 RepID=UPI00366CCDC1
MNDKFVGVYPVLVTPFNEDGSFRLEAAKEHADWLVEQGIKNAIVLGATGEYQSLTNDEHKYYISEMVPYLKEKGLTVAAGVGRERPDDVIELMNHDQAAGLDIGMLLPPFYSNPNQTEIVENYRYIAEHTTLPIMLYNNPWNSGVNLTRESLQELFKLPAAKAFKESTADIHRTTEALIDAPDDVNVFCGDENMALESFMMGAKAWVCLSVNFAPKTALRLYDAAMSGDWEFAKKHYAQYLPVFDLMENAEKVPATIKYIVTKYRGIDVGSVRRPRLDLTAEEKAAVDAVFDFAGIE